MPNAMPRWRVEQFRGRRVEYLGMVEAADEQGALAQAVKRYDIPAALQFKITVTRIADKGTTS